MCLVSMCFAAGVLVTSPPECWSPTTTSPPCPSVSPPHQMFYFVHISKAGGSSFGRALTTLCSISGRSQRTLCPVQPCNHPFTSTLGSRRVPSTANSTCNIVFTEGSIASQQPRIELLWHRQQQQISHILLLREPLAIVVSMWEHCQHGRGSQLHRYRNISFQRWVGVFSGPVSLPSQAVTSAKRYCGFDPRNRQTRLLGGSRATDRDFDPSLAMDGTRDGFLELAKRRVREALFVGVLEEAPGLLCLVRARLQLEEFDACMAMGGGDALPRVNHTASRGKKPILDENTTSQVQSFTAADRLLHSEARQRFQNDVHAWTRAAVARRSSGGARGP